MKHREARAQVLLSARICSGTTWSDTSILNVSSRGMGLQAVKPPPRGTYVEIGKGHYRIVAQVVWSHGHRFGVRTQDDVDLHILSAQALPRNKHRAGDAVVQGPAVKWRALPKRHAEAAERNRLIGRATEFACIGFGAAAAAVIVFETLQQTLDKPTAQLVHALDGTPPPP